MQTADASSTTRRILLAKAAAGAAIVAVPAGAAMADVSRTEGDAELLALGQELAQAWKAELDTWAWADGLPTDAQHRAAAEAQGEAATDASAAIVDRIGAIPATGLPGLIVKARAVHWCMGSGPIDLGNEQGTRDLRLAEQVLTELLAMGSTAHG